MKKGISLLIILVLAAMMYFPAMAEDTGSGKDISGIWEDPNVDGMQVLIIPSEVCWPDDLLGQEASAGKYVVIMNWPESAWTTNIYQMVGTLDDTGRTLTYESAFYGVYTFDENGDVDDENTGEVKNDGSGAFTLQDNGLLRWSDSYVVNTEVVALERQIAEAPSAEDIRREYYQKVIGLEVGTAGASLKLAQTVHDVLQFCSAAAFWSMDDEAFAAHLQAAQDGLTAEEKAAFDQNRGIVTLEITRLLNEEEELGGVYADAGVEDQMIELRGDPSVRLSVETFLFAVETLNENP